jgi:hypothetical protein
MCKAFIGLLVLLGLSVGGLWWLDPATTKKTLDEMTVSASKAVTEIQTKFNSK